MQQILRAPAPGHSCILSLTTMRMVPYTTTCICMHLIPQRCCTWLTQLLAASLTYMWRYLEPGVSSKSSFSVFRCKVEIPLGKVVKPLLCVHKVVVLARMFDSQHICVGVSGGSSLELWGSSLELWGSLLELMGWSILPYTLERPR